MKNLMLKSLLCSVVVFGGMSVYAETTGPDSLDISQLAEDVESANPADVEGLMELREAMNALTDKALAENPKLRKRRDLIKGGFAETFQAPGKTARL